MSSAYRERQEALRDRREALARRLDELDQELGGAPSSRRLPTVLRSRLEDLRVRATPTDESVESLQVAELAADRFEDTLDEALGLGAELRKSVDPILPRKESLVRWAGFATLSLVVMFAMVYELGMSDFMLRAFGVKVSRASIELSTSPTVRRAVVRLGAVPESDMPPLPRYHAMPTVVPPRPEPPAEESVDTEPSE
ncbi:MAG: hypothetical protein RIF41_37710 [Polyangiaceae bacterium]